MTRRIGITRPLLTAVITFSPAFLWGGQAPVATAVKLTADLPSDEEFADKITRTELRRLANLREYSAFCKYTLQNSHMKDDAEMTVRLNYAAGSGKSFEIMDIKNASGLSRKVLERLTQSEAESSRRATRDEFQITKANYKFHGLGASTYRGRPCYVVEVTAKRKSKYLVDGKAWVDPNEFAILKIEGRPAASLSFWVGKPYIVQEFQKIGPFWMASHNRSESESWLLGHSVLTIDYSDYEIAPAIRMAERNLPAAKAAASVE